MGNRVFARVLSVTGPGGRVDSASSSSPPVVVGFGKP